MEFTMVKTCEAEAYDAIPKFLIRVDIENALVLLKDAGYKEIADAGVMCVVEKDQLELTVFSGGRVLLKTSDEKTAEDAAKRLFEVIEGALE